MCRSLKLCVQFVNTSTPSSYVNTSLTSGYFTRLQAEAGESNVSALACTETIFLGRRALKKGLEAAEMTEMAEDPSSTWQMLLASWKRSINQA